MSVGMWTVQFLMFSRGGALLFKCMLAHAGKSSSAPAPQPTGAGLGGTLPLSALGCISYIFKAHVDHTLRVFAHRLVFPAWWVSQQDKRGQAVSSHNLKPQA